jgi:hypothetical protein
MRAILVGTVVGLLGCATESQPVVHYDTEPTLVDIAPGVSVIADSENEVFFTDGYYWVNYGGHWWRAPNYHGRWVVAETRIVPVQVRSYPPGQYVHYRKISAEPERHTVEEHNIPAPHELP